MRFLPRLGLFPAPIPGGISEKSREIRRQGGLIVFGDEDVGAFKAIHLRTQFALGMHRVEREDPSFDESGREKRLERADLVLLFADIDLEEDHARRDIVGAQLMNWLGFLARRPHRFAINRHMRMLSMP